ncbi:MAG: sugar phosphate isomerase/epimerase, partial [Clostridia bacterium]|nr:sugar phosphate isomerase/epimerase [Clostridia bacterium]
YHMHFGKHWYVPENPVDIRWYCQKSKELGAGGLHFDPYHIDIDKDTEWVRNFAESNCMYVELGAFGTSIGELRASIDAASRLGAKLLRTFAGGSCLDGRAATAERAMVIKKQISGVLPYAEKMKISIALENHGDLYIEDIQTVLELESDYLGVCYDSGNFAFTNENPLDGLEAFEDRILCTHLKDVCHKDNFPHAKPFITVDEPVHFCALGEGFLPMDKLVSKLSATGIENITLEICSPYDESMMENDLLAFESDNVVKSVSYISSLF